MKQRNVFLFFVLPFLGVFLFFALAPSWARPTSSEGRRSWSGTSSGPRPAFSARRPSRYLDEGLAPEAVLDAILSDEDLYFVALLDAKHDVLAWNSRFEGYLPISLSAVRDDQPGIIDSPAGKIFSDLSALTTKDGRRFHLYMGYALTGMEAMIARSRRTSLLLSGLVLLAGAVFFRGLYQLQSRYMAKSREADAERQEKERFREISAFTSGVAHEIKNPLNSLSLVLELLGRKVPPDSKGEVDLGKAQVRTISRIVDRFSRVVKAVRPEAEPLDLGDVLGQAVENLVAEVPAAAPRLHILAAPGVRLTADRDLLTQAFLIILKNAVEASADAPVRAAGRRSGLKVEVLISDEGPGFPADVADRVFEPFFSTKENGLGIGLYLARRIIEAHGGTIEVHSREGEGTEFRISLPGA